jgi:Na+-transporting NADH:ubiquinone oxidoreductase subunit NqrC
MKARVTEKDNIAGIIVDAAKKVLADVQQRCTEALKALDQHDYLVVIGALTGLEEQIRYVTVRLMVLREIREIQNRNIRRNILRLNGRRGSRKRLSKSFWSRLQNRKKKLRPYAKISPKKKVSSRKCRTPQKCFRPSNTLEFAH